MFLLIVLVGCGGGGGGGGETPTDPADQYTPVVSAPDGLTASGISGSQIDLTWTDMSTDEEGFKIERKLSGGTYTEIAVVGANVTTFSDTGLSSNTTYIYRVRAYNSNGNSYYSNESTAATATIPPVAPGGLGASAVSESQIDLTWTDNSANESGFRIERSPDGSSGWTEIDTVNADVTTFSDTGLSKNTQYYYRVRAYNGAGESAWSSNADATTNDMIPQAPTSLTSVGASSSQVNLTWSDNSDNEVGFKIERSLNGTTWNQVTTVGAGTVSYSDTGLDHATLYHYRVRAYNIVGDSAYSNVDTAQTVDIVPDAPTGLQLSVNGQSITLTWVDNSDNETSFKIYRSPDGTTWTNVDSVSANIETWTDTGLSPLTQYSYRVVAHNSIGESLPSNEETAQTQDVAPDAPSSLQANAQSSSQISLAWTDNSNNEQGFKIERSPDGTSGWTLVNTVGANASSYTDSSLSQETSYYYRVYAYNAVGNSDYSNTANATTSGSSRTLIVNPNFDDGPVRSVCASQPIRINVYSDSSCTTLVDSGAVASREDGMAEFHPDVSPVYVMAYHDVNNNGARDAGETYSYFVERDSTPGNPVNVAEGTTRTITVRLNDAELSSNTILNVLVHFTGAGAVDNSKRIFAVSISQLRDCFDMGHNVQSAGANDCVMNFQWVKYRQMQLVVFYDRDGNGTLSDGDSYMMYNGATNAGFENEPSNNLVFSDGETKNVEVTFDDTHIVQSRSLNVTVNYTGSQGTVSVNNRLNVESYPIVGDGTLAEGHANEKIILSNGGSVTFDDIFTSTCAVLVWFDANGNGYPDAGEPYMMYDSKLLKDGYTPVSITPGTTGSITINLDDSRGLPDFGWEDDDNIPFLKINGSGDAFSMTLCGIRPASTGTYIIGQNGFRGVILGKDGVPYEELMAKSGTVTITSLSPLTGTFSLSYFSDGSIGTPYFTSDAVTGSFSNIPVDGSTGGSFSATGTVDGYSMDITAETGSVFTPARCTAHVENLPLPTGVYKCSVRAVRARDFQYCRMEFEGEIVVFLGQGTIVLYAGDEDNYEDIVSGETYSYIMFIGSDGRNIAHGEYHSTPVNVVYNGGDIGDITFDTWIQYENSGALDPGECQLHGTIENFPLSGQQSFRIRIINPVTVQSAGGWMPPTGTTSGMAYFRASTQNVLEGGMQYKVVLWTDTNPNGIIDTGEYVSEVVSATFNGQSNILTGMTFSTWTQYSLGSSATLPVTISGSLSGCPDGSYALHVRIDDLYGNHYSDFSTTVTVSGGTCSYSVSNSYLQMYQGETYFYSVYLDCNSNNQLDAGDYCSGFQGRVCDGTSTVSSLDFTLAERIPGTVYGSPYSFAGTISGLTLDNTTRNYIRMMVVHTAYSNWYIEGNGLSVYGLNIDVSSTPYNLNASCNTYGLRIGKPYYYMMWFDANTNGSLDPGEQRCMLTNGNNGYVYDGTNTVNGLNFNSWSPAP